MLSGSNSRCGALSNEAATDASCERKRHPVLYARQSYTLSHSFRIKRPSPDSYSTSRSRVQSISRYRNVTTMKRLRTHTIVQELDYSTAPASSIQIQHDIQLACLTIFLDRTSYNKATICPALYLAIWSPGIKKSSTRKFSPPTTPLSYLPAIDGRRACVSGEMRLRGCA